MTTRVICRALRSGLLALALALAPAGPAAADDREQARALFSQGEREFALGNLTEARDLFERAYRLRPVPGLLWNIAQCHRLLGELEKARRVYRSFLAKVPSGPHADRARELLAEVEHALDSQAQAQTAPPADVAAPEAVEQPKHDEPPAPLAQPQQTPAPPPKAAAPRPAFVQPPPAPPPATGGRQVRAAAWITGGAGVAALGFGAIMFAGAKSAESDLHGSVHTSQQAHDLISTGKSKSTLATVGLVGGLAACAGAAVLFLF